MQTNHKPPKDWGEFLPPMVGIAIIMACIIAMHKVL